MLQIQNLSFSYADKKVIDNLNLCVKEGETVAIIGASGVGKTTLFRILSGSHLALGSIMWKKRPLTSSLISYMTQQDLLLPWRTILGNVLLLDELGPKREIRKEEALLLLDEVELLSHRDSYPHMLSGGMKQRAALARVLLQNKPLLLLDEPFRSLDYRTKKRLYSLVKSVQKKHGLTIILITHDPAEAVAVCDRIFLMLEGTIVKEWRSNEEGLIEALIQSITAYSSI